MERDLRGWYVQYTHAFESRYSIGRDPNVSSDCYVHHCVEQTLFELSGKGEWQ